MNNNFDNKTLRSKLECKSEREIVNLEANTELALKTIDRLKYDTLRNILFIILGSLITLIASNLSSENNQIQPLNMYKARLHELNRLEKLNRIHIREIQLELKKLKKNINESVDID